MTSFRDKVRGGEPLIGTWMKTPSAIVAEVLGLTSLDCVCLDAEHAPFDRLAIDGSVAALRAAGKPALVRVPEMSAAAVLNALDCGATGIVMPHVTNADQANALVAMSHYGPGGRGYAGSSRAASYTTSGMADNLAQARETTCVIAQIEDLPALDAIDDIAAVEGIDCLFIGRIDLTIALGARSPKDKPVVDAVDTICAAGKKAGRPVGMFVSDLAEIPHWQQAGANLFLLQSDHNFLLEGANTLRERFDQAVCLTR
ncbi:MAG: aldolase/citrate lyase family protein [Pseudomonadota bacterium]